MSLVTENDPPMADMRPDTPPAHQLDWGQPVLWRVYSCEANPNLQIWNKKTQDLVSIPFQSIVETLQEKQTEHRRAAEIVWNYPDQVKQQGCEEDQNIDNIDNGPFNKLVHRKLGQSEEGQKAKERAQLIKKIDKAVAKAEETINNCGDSKQFKMLTKQASGSKIEPNPKVKLSNSERCRIFRENR